MRTWLGLGLVCLVVAVGCESPPPKRRNTVSSFELRSPTVRISVVSCQGDPDMLPVPKMPYSLAIRYPGDRAHTGAKGQVLATVMLDPEGKVTGAYVSRATDVAFSTAVLDGIRNCAFFPAQRHGKPIQCIAQCMIDFSLERD